jgi:tetratricopeptide (TPR) repeat protein
MARWIRFCFTAALFVFAAGSLRAADSGQEDLDKATEAKLTAETTTDLGEVIRLTESAIGKGLDEANAEFAKKLLISTVIQRAAEMTKRILVNLTSVEEFHQRRKLILADLARAAKLDPKQTQVYLLIAQVNSLPEGDAKQGKEALDKALELGFDDVESRAKALMLRAGFQEETEKKVADFDEAVRLMPNDALAVRARGLAMADMNKLDASLADLTRAIELEPNDVRTYEAKAIVLARLKKFDEALAALEKARELNPNSVAPLVELARIHVQQEKADAALDDLSQALKLDPDNSEVLLLRVSILTRLKKYDEALAALGKIQQLNPKSTEPLVEQARVHAQQEKPDSAIDDLSQALKLDPENVEVLLLRAGVYQEKGDKVKAMADVDQTLKLRPDLAMAIRTRALFLAEDKRFDEAAADLEKLHERNPKDTLTLLQLAMLYGAQKKSDQAIDAYSAVLAEDPDEWRAWQGRADLRLNIGKHAEAVADYEKAIKLHRKSESILNNFAWVLATSPDDKLRDGKRAIQLATEACELTDYKLAYILSTLAAAYAETGDFETAVKWSGKAVEIGDKQHDGSLKKELESYKAKKPIRERLTGNEPAENEDELPNKP